MALQPTAKTPTGMANHTTVGERYSVRDTMGKINASRIGTTQILPECDSSASRSFGDRDCGSLLDAALVIRPSSAQPSAALDKKYRGVP